MVIARVVVAAQRDKIGVIIYGRSDATDLPVLGGARDFFSEQSIRLYHY